MVGGGVAVAQNGALTSGADKPVVERLDDVADDEQPDISSSDDPVADDDPDGAACPEASAFGLDTANEAGNEDQPGDCPPIAEDADTDALNDDDRVIDVPNPSDEVEESEEQSGEEPAAQADDGADAEAFSTWVESLNGEELGCLKGQLVSHFARQGPTEFAEPALNAEDAQAIADFLEDNGRGLPGRCAERILNNDDAIGEGDDEVEVEDTSGESGPPEHAGKPDNVGKPQVGTQKQPGPPQHVSSRGNGDGPGMSGNAPGRSGKGNGGS